MIKGKKYFVRILNKSGVIVWSYDNILALSKEEAETIALSFYAQIKLGFKTEAEEVRKERESLGEKTNDQI